MVNLSLQDPATTGEKPKITIKNNSIQLIRIEYRNKGQRMHLQKWVSQISTLSGRKRGPTASEAWQGRKNGTKKLKYILGRLL